MPLAYCLPDERPPGPPPLTTAPIPLAVLPDPPLTTARAAGRVADPPADHGARPLAVLPIPPLTTAASPLAVLLSRR